MKDAELIYGRLLEEQEIAQVSGGGMTSTSTFGEPDGTSTRYDDDPAMR